MAEKKLKVLDLDTPPEILIKPSQVEPHKYGIWCRQLIKEGTKFGPFIGEKAYEVDETMDPAFIWEIVDVETKEFLFYINATNPRYGNWMRHINCARFFEEQNIVSEQEGIDIYYHAIKDILPGEELLTWYEKSPVRKKKGKKKIFPNVKRARTGDETKVASRSSDYDSVSLRGRKRTARKFWEMEEVGVRSSAIEGSENDAVDNNANNDEDEDDEDWDAAQKYGSAGSNVKSRNSSLAPTAASSAANSISSGRNSPDADSSQDLASTIEPLPQCTEKNKNDKQTPPDCSGPYFHFESMVDQGGNGGSNSSTGGLWKNGRRVFRCDICSGIYRHSFSLKRHYVRSHINFLYLNKVDIIQCGVQPPKPTIIQQNSSDKMTHTSAPITSDEDLGVVGQTSLTKDPQKLEEREVSPESGHKKVMSDMYRCNICEQFFGTKEELRFHLSNHPDGEVGGQRQFSCSHCKMQFKHRQNLMRHEVVHTGAKPFSCQQCHKSFPTATNQKRHERIHDGHRLTCDLCPASFTQTGDLKKHASKQHPESYNECAYCSKYFSVESALDAHLKKAHGKDVEANRRRVCVKKKEKKVLLEKDRAESRRLAIEEADKRHSSRASSEESYACTVCRKCFHNYSNMCRHRRLAHYKDAKGDDLYGIDDEEDPGKTTAAAGHQMPPSSSSSSCTGAHQSGGVSTRSSGACSVEIGYKHFLAVARNIPKNLELYIEGTQQDLDNAKHHIKWKVPDKMRLEVSESDKAKGNLNLKLSATPLADVVLEDYNFPKGSRIKPIILENGDPVSLDDQNLSEDGQITETKKESKDNETFDDKSFMRFCGHCKMNFADERGYAIHISSCSSKFEPTITKQMPIVPENVHDYSKKANPREEAFKVFPELSKLPASLFSEEEILDLSKHKDCIYQSSSITNGVNFSCSASAEEPLDLTGSKNIVQDTKNECDFFSSGQDKPCISSCKKEASSELQTKPSSAPVFIQNDVQTVKNKSHKKIICLVCYLDFVDKEAALDHQEAVHGNVDCRYAEVDDDFEVSMLKTPKPTGLLGTSQLMFIAEKIEEEALREEKTAEVEDISDKKETMEIVEKTDDDDVESLKDECADVSTEDLHMTVVSEATEVADVEFINGDSVACTKCRQRFANISSLHAHISENCGDYWRNLNERVSWVFVLRGNLVRPEQEQPNGSNQPKKRGKFKWQQQTSNNNSNNPLPIRSNGTNEESTKRQIPGTAACRSGPTATSALDPNRKLVGNKVLTRKRSQEIGAAVVTGMEDPDYYVRNKRKAIMQQNSKKGTKRQHSMDSTTSKAFLADGSDSNQAGSSLEEESLANPDAFVDNNNDDDDDDDYDPNKFMCIYCGHQFQYTRTLRKHVVEFCHVRKEYVEKGEYLDLEWEEDLASKVQPPPATPTETTEETEDAKKSGGRKKKRRSWCPRGYSNNQKNPQLGQTPETPDRNISSSSLPVQLQSSLTRVNQPSEAGDGSVQVSNLSVPMTTPGGTIVVKADDVCSGESDLMVSCESIPHEMEDDTESNKTTSICIPSSSCPRNEFSFVEPFAMTSALSRHPTTGSSSPSAQDLNISSDDCGRFEGEEVEDGDGDGGTHGLMMTVTSSPAAKHPRDHLPWEASAAASAAAADRKKQKLSASPCTFQAQSDPNDTSEDNNLF